MAKERTPEEEEAFEEFRRARFPHERSREIAETEFARSQGTALKRGQATRLADEFLLGSPTRDGNVETFTDPQGRSNTFRAGTNQLLAQGGPVINDKLYSPFDQKQLNKLYQGRSQAATDESLTEEERQKAMDIFDTQISRVPQLAPSRREPTAQQKFEASIVKAPDGTQGTIDKSGNFKPLELGKAQADRQAAYNETLMKTLTASLKTNEGREGADVRTFDDMLNEAQTLAGIGHGFEFAKNFDKPIAPELKNDWIGAMASLDRTTGRKGIISKRQVRATEKQMLTEMDSYVASATGKGLNPNVAFTDFLNRWNKEAEKDTYGLVPPIPSGLKQKLQLGKLVATHPASAPMALQASQSSARVNGKDVALPQGPVARVNGKDVPIPSQQGQLLVRNKKGQIGYIPAGELQEALDNGFTLVK